MNKCSEGEHCTTIDTYYYWELQSRQKASSMEVVLAE